jgi:hypothetical protein
MSDQDQHAPFFIGWSRTVPAPVLRFSALVALLIVLLLGGIGALLGGSVEDAANRLLGLSPAVETRAQDWAGDQMMRGAISRTPFPILHVAPDLAHPSGQTVLLVGEGKHGAVVPATETAVDVTGALLRRGDVSMLVIDTVKPIDEAAAPPSRQSLGRWRILGEICDGKCWTGAMRPGSGLAHRACANLCLIGDVPPIFVTAAPVAGRSFLVLAGPDGGAPPAELRDLTALLVELEGEVERVGDILVLKADPNRARVP